MERREERLEKRREPIGLRFESGRGAMQTRAPPICLFEPVAKKSIAFERAINQVTLCMFQWSSRDELFPVDGEFGPSNSQEEKSLNRERKQNRRALGRPKKF